LSTRSMSLSVTELISTTFQVMATCTSSCLFPNRQAVAQT
jgi:hypothetical protein